MLKFTKVFFAAVVVTMASGAAYAHTNKLNQLFRNPLIMGASVSSGFLTKGPGTIATETIMGHDTSYNIARNGARGMYFANINPGSLAPYSLILAVDFLFWDSSHEDTTKSEAALENLVVSAQKARVPLVLGDIPDLYFFQNEQSRKNLNQKIRKLCRKQNGCYILEFEKLHTEASNEGIIFGKYLYKFFDLTFDGMHVNGVGSHYIAQKIIDLLA